jgi:ATP-dependent DNA ligase
LPLVSSSNPFNDQDWIFEIKYDGIRALAYVLGDDCQLVASDQSKLKDFKCICSAILSGLNARDTVLDGEIVSMDENGVINHSSAAHVAMLLPVAYQPGYLPGDLPG